MKKFGLFLTVSAVVFCFVTSCEKEGEDHLNTWMVANITAFNAIKTNPDYKEIKSPGNEESIYYKVLNKGDGTDPILYTSIVNCYYKGYFVADYPNYSITNGKVFDQQLFDDGPSATFAVSGVVSGWKTALQHMVKGDKWEIWIPYQLGYGRSNYQNTGSTIPGYSTLVFELEVVGVRGIDD